MGIPHKSNYSEITITSFPLLNLFVFVIHTRQQVKHEMNSYRLHYHRNHSATVIDIHSDDVHVGEDYTDVSSKFQQDSLNI